MALGANCALHLGHELEVWVHALSFASLSALTWYHHWSTHVGLQHPRIAEVVVGGLYSLCLSRWSDSHHIPEGSRTC